MRFLRSVPWCCRLIEGKSYSKFNMIGSIQINDLFQVSKENYGKLLPHKFSLVSNEFFFAVFSRWLKFAHLKTKKYSLFSSLQWCKRNHLVSNFKKKYLRRSFLLHIWSSKREVGGVESKRTATCVFVENDEKNNKQSDGEAENNENVWAITTICVYTPSWKGCMAYE